MESELVAGFFTEHSATLFVFFFLGEYSSIVLFSTISAIFFLGGYNLPEIFVNESLLNFQAIILGIKTSFFCFLFVCLVVGFRIAVRCLAARGFN